MFSIVPLFLLIISLGVIVVLVVRKYPELTLLDLDTIPDRKEKQKKKEILSRKASKRSKEQQEKFVGFLIPFTHAWKSVQSSFRTYVKKIKDDVESAKKEKNESVVRTTDTPISQDVSIPSVSVRREETIEDILKKGERALNEKKFQEAESAFIRAIETDQKYAAAYVGLGDVYEAQQQLNEAKETYLFAKKLDPQNTSLLEKLAHLAVQKEEWIEAIQYYEEAVLVDDMSHSMFATLADLFLKTEEPQSAYEAISQAVELHPKHLSYLDSLAEISIMVQDKIHAEEAVQAIRMIDPEYTRLTLLKDRIAEMDNA